MDHAMNNPVESFFVDQAWLFPLFILMWSVIWIVATASLSRLSGWYLLASRFKATIEPEGNKYRFVSGSIGRRILPISYRSCLFVTVGKTGIHISILFPFRLGSAPLLIPWSAIETAEPKRFLFLFPSVTISVKDCWQQISLRGKVQEAVVNAFASHLRETKPHRDSWRNK